MTEENGCKNCAFAEWQHTKTGRIRNASGRCTYIIPLPKLPASVSHVFDLNNQKSCVWVGDGKNCPCFKVKETP